MKAIREEVEEPCKEMFSNSDKQPNMPIWFRVVANKARMAKADIFVKIYFFIYYYPTRNVT